MRIPPMPTPAEVVKIYGLSARKTLSQNFLFDQNLCDRFVALADPFVERSYVCEFGPGPGSLTRSILRRKPEQLVVIEKDDRFLPALKTIRGLAGPGRMRIVWGDILKYKMETAFANATPSRPWDARPNVSLIGNLPFNISTPLIVQLMRHMANRTGVFQHGRVHMVLAFQKEVAERLLAPVSHTQRSRLSIITQAYASISDHFIIEGSSFVPPPKVDVAVLRFVPLLEPRLDVPFDDLYMMARVIFSHRRKMIRHTVRSMFREDRNKADEFFRMAGVADILRAQELTLDEWGRLCKAYIAMKHLATGIRNFEVDPHVAMYGEDGEFGGVFGEVSFKKRHKEPDIVAVEDDPDGGKSVEEQEIYRNTLDSSPLITRHL